MEAAYRLSEQDCRDFEISSRREWVLTNGLGSYAMGTAAGVNTRRYHGHLVAAKEDPANRLVLLENFEIEIDVAGACWQLSTNQYGGLVHPRGFEWLTSFSADSSVAWLWSDGNWGLEKTLWMETGHNTIGLCFRNAGSSRFTLRLRPLVACKFYHENNHESGDIQYTVSPGSVLVQRPAGSLELRFRETDVRGIGAWYHRLERLREFERGLDPYEDLFCPAEIQCVLEPGQEFTVTAGDGESWMTSGLPPLHSLTGALEVATQRFLVTGQSRSTIIAGYPWFADWGRDTMISLSGVCLVNGKLDTAKRILADYAGQMRHGLIPNRFVEVGEPEFNTVDATLWWICRVGETYEATKDKDWLSELWPSLRNAYDCYRFGTINGIEVDQDDGLVRHGPQLTWMDAKVSGEAVTPRAGKAIEISALWIEALAHLVRMAEALGEEVSAFEAAASPAIKSFDESFWCEELGFYADLADPLDRSLRPNQVIALSMPGLDVPEQHARRALEAVREQLLTPYGLRTLSPQDPHYKGRFKGSLSELDRAYHQGTVWPWLLGPYCSAWLRWFGDRDHPAECLREVPQMLRSYGLGGIAEVYDGDAPHRPHGCPWQAWSVAEVLRIARTLDLAFR